MGGGYTGKGVNEQLLTSKHDLLCVNLYIRVNDTLQKLKMRCSLGFRPKVCCNSLDPRPNNFTSS